jgi:hypothetical protein
MSSNLAISIVAFKSAIFTKLFIVFVNFVISSSIVNFKDDLLLYTIFALITSVCNKFQVYDV